MHIYARMDGKLARWKAADGSDIQEARDSLARMALQGRIGPQKLALPILAVIDGGKCKQAERS